MNNLSCIENKKSDKFVFIRSIIESSADSFIK